MVFFVFWKGTVKEGCSYHLFELGGVSIMGDDIICMNYYSMVKSNKKNRALNLITLVFIRIFSLCLVSFI